MSGNRKGKRQRIIIQLRDLSLFAALVILRFADREQLQVVAPFGSVSRANDRLLKLSRAGYLHRRFIGTIANGRKTIYSLAEPAALLVKADTSTLVRLPSELRQGDAHYEHQLALNRVYLQLKCGKEATGSLRLDHWQTFAKPIVPFLPLVPDAYCQLTSPTSSIGAFIEADLGTETRKVWQQKIELYLTFALRGDFQQMFGLPQFRVLLLTTSLRRVKHLQALIARRTTKIFWLTTFSEVNDKGISAAIWYRPTSQEPQAFG